MTSGISEITLAGADRPGKIIAVHLNYRSRAEQRGRVPDLPSYFLKPASSLSASGDVIVRPMGAELLAFEGEVAIIIGASARNVQPDEALACISGVTAANDFGIYDLRKADKGSNLRSKGGDGFTPIGPRVIPSADLDLRALRVRTWLNDELVQEDVTSNLLFPFEQLVADLSQVMTLEPGDVILTGTPAGSSVAQPGDVVAVEVDAPSAPGAPSSGKLITTVAEGTIPFGDFGSKPAVDDLQRKEAWGLPDEVESSADEEIDWAALAEGTGTASVSSELRRRGLVEIFVDGVHAMGPNESMIGPARTLRFIGFRADLFAAKGGGYNKQKQAFDQIGAGEVLVIEARQKGTAGTVGDILALRAEARGAAGVVTDGCVRDGGIVSGLDLPVFAQGAHPSVLGRHHVPWETDVAVTCGGVAIIPGDIVMGDADGVIVIPRDIAVDVLQAAVAQEAEDAYIADLVRKGEAVEHIFPLNASWRAKYEAERSNTQNH